MKPETKNHLKQARRNLGKCASKIHARRTSACPLNQNEHEMVIGFGTAHDWVRWAFALEDLKFSTKSEGLSARSQGIVESVRFNQMWTAVNALFAKDSILSVASSPVPLTPTICSSELNRFDLIYRAANLNPSIEGPCVHNLNELLSMECQADGIVGVLTADGTPVMWEVIYHKYMRPEDKRRPLGRLINTAIQNAQVAHAAADAAGTKRTAQPKPQVRGPDIIYAARNWAVHGMLLTSFFRGSQQKYITFIDNITLLLAAVLDGSARTLLPKL